MLMWIRQSLYITWRRSMSVFFPVPAASESLCSSAHWKHISWEEKNFSKALPWKGLSRIGMCIPCSESILQMEISVTPMHCLTG